MPDKYPKFKAAVSQIAPSFLNREETVEIACKAIEEAGKEGAGIIAFPESFIPGYPYWIWMETPFAAAKYFKDFFKNSVEVPGTSTRLLCQSAKKADCYVVMGMTSREGGTLYNSMLFIDNKGAIMGYRRKLVPTVAERMIWGRGDGSDLCVYDTEMGKIGGLICGENTMLLVKYALLAKGEQIHIANFPGSPLSDPQKLDLILRCYSILGQIFILNSVNFVSEEMRGKIFNTGAKNEFYIDAYNGGSSIISPRGGYLAKPVLNKEMIVYADIDLEMIIDAKRTSDCIGHYARPDVAKLLINEEKNVMVESSKSDFGFAANKNNAEFENDLKKMLSGVEKEGNPALRNLVENFVRKYT